ncbi:MAG: hypothetical protein AB7U20_15490 [Planctomycetaceae bacterium]
MPGAFGTLKARLSRSADGWWIPDRQWLIVPSVESDENFQDAVAWAREFTPDADKDAYSTALDHAHRKYALSVDHFDAIDKKTDELMKTAITLTALLVAAVKALEFEVTSWFYGAFACFLGAIILAVIARRLTLPETPGNVREVLGFVEDFRIHDRYQVEALLAASFHCAVVGTQPLIRWKAQQLVRATALFILGVLLLPLSF